jgi:hypothetical protein
MPDRSDEVKVSEENAARVFLRAAEIDADARSTLSISQVRQIALEAGISPRAVDLALEELKGQSAHAGSEGLSKVATRAPAWVRFCMWGVPDRRIATGYYWVFLAAFLAFPVGRLLFGNSDALTMAGMAFCVFSLWSTSRAIRWLDAHGWGLLERKAS